MMNFNQLLIEIGDLMWGWPLIVVFILSGSIITFMLNFVQFRYFFKSWKLALFSVNEKSEGEITPFQALISSLSSSSGNGSIAGIAIAIATGGPGAAFWLFIAGVFCLGMRFAEVYASTSIIDTNPDNPIKSGPMVYIKMLPGGRVLSYIFTVAMFLMGIVGGSAVQTNSIGVSFVRTWGINKYIVAAVLFVFITYAILGGAKRIMRLSEIIVPFKVAIFIISSLIVLVYHYSSIIPAIKLMIMSALSPQAAGGAVIGFTIMKSIRSSLPRILTASEAGLGTAGVLFGATGSKYPMKDSIMSMFGAFLSTYFVCFMVALSIVASGVWNNGQTSTALTISAFETVFGSYGGWIVTFCSVSFGIGVLVTFAFITRETWLFITNGRWGWVSSVLYCLAAFLGGIAKVDIVWNSIDILIGVMFLINICAVVYLLPLMRKTMQKDIKQENI